MILRLTQAIVMGVALAACSAETPDPSLSAAAPEAQTRKTEVDEVARAGTVIVMLGDSLTAGWGLPADAAVPSITENLLQADGYNVAIVNAGVSGDTTAMGLARYDWSVTSADPDMLIIALGANDFLGRLPADVARNNLSKIIEKAQAQGLEIVLAGLQPRWPETDVSLEQEYSSLYPELAETYGVALYPGFMTGVWNEPDHLMPDGLHPNMKGVNVMAKGLSAFLEGELSPDSHP